MVIVMILEKVVWGQQMDKTCQKCVNFIEENDLLSCDYEYFDNVIYSVGILYVPDMFDCVNFEWSYEYVNNR